MRARLSFVLPSILSIALVTPAFAQPKEEPDCAASAMDG